MTGLLGGVTLQLRIFRRTPASLLLFLVMPFFSAIFLSAAIARGVHPGPRPVLAPAMIGLWLVSVIMAEMLISMERGHGTLEMAIAAPTRYASMLAGRVLTVTMIGLLTVPEALAVARLGFGVTLTVYHPGMFAAAMLGTALGTAGMATALTAVFLAFRGAQRYVNTLGYPFYILSGLLVPVSYLPAYIRPLSYVLYLHWSANLVYASLAPGPVRGAAQQIAVLVLIGAASYAAGSVLVHRVIGHLRTAGTAGLT